MMNILCIVDIILVIIIGLYYKINKGDIFGIIAIVTGTIMLITYILILLDMYII